MNPLRRLDQVMRHHPVRADAVAAAVLLLLFAAVPWITLATPVAGNGLDIVVLAVITTGMILPWAVRRVRPVGSAAVVLVFALLHLFVGPELTGAVVVVPMTVYNLAANGPRWASRAGLVIGLLGGTANGLKVWLFPSALFPAEAATVRSPPTPEAFVFMTLVCGMAVLTAWAFGDVVRSRRLAVQALQDRAHRLETQALQERELAAADERSHIAREMHDIVAHSLQVIISQSDGARYAAAAKPELAVATLETIGQTGRTALADMRQLLGVLRGPADAGADRGRRDPATRDAHRAPPGLADVPDLLATMRLSGMEVSLLEDGAPRRDLPAGGELTAYRTVQEALTNTLRHAGPDARAFVTLTWTSRGLDLRVDDDGRGAAAGPGTAGSGQGLRGMAERVALFGGSASAGPRAYGGWHVEAHLPYAAV